MVLGIGWITAFALHGAFVALQVTGPTPSPDARTGGGGVRTDGVALANLVTEGREHSSTFRRLARQVEASDWIVFVQRGSCRAPGVFACLLHRVGVFQGHRYLRIVIGEGVRAGDDLIATIGHELQHAVEVVSEPSLASSADIWRLYRRIGHVSIRMVGGEVFETDRAVRAAAAIHEELRSDRMAVVRQRSASR